MRKRVFVFLLLLTLVLTACGQRNTIHLVEYDNHLLSLDTANQTITQGDTVYRYEVSGGSYTILYPDGATYTMTWSGSTGAGGGNELYYGEDRLDGGGLIDLVKKYEDQASPRRSNPANFLWGLLCIGLGVFNAAAPYASWYIGHGWRYENAEPSEAYLVLIRVGGGIMIIVGIIALFV